MLMYGWLVMETGERGRGDEGGSDTDLSRRFVEVEDEDSVVDEKKNVDKKSTNGKKNEVRGKSNQ